MNIQMNEARRSDAIQPVVVQTSQRAQRDSGGLERAPGNRPLPQELRERLRNFVARPREPGSRGLPQWLAKLPPGLRATAEKFIHRREAQHAHAHEKEHPRAWDASTELDLGSRRAPEPSPAATREVR